MMLQVDDFFGEIISEYSTKNATDDGVLFDIRTVNKNWGRGIISHVTTNLMEKEGYMLEGNIKIPNLVDLLTQCQEIVKKGVLETGELDTFYSGEIEMPSGEKQKVFIGMNEMKKFTIMLPEDY